MKVVAIIQARISSIRLPGKILLPLAGKPLLANLVDRACRATRLHSVVVTYPLKDHEAMMGALNQRTDDEHYRPIGIYASQDPEDDLVARYLHAAEAHHADVIVRIPGDNPCVEPEYIDQAIEKYLEWPEVFVSNAELSRVGEQWVDGLGCEVFSVSRLRWLDRLTAGKPEYREHPHKFFHDHRPPPRQIEMVEVLRLDVNTQADYEFIKDIYDHFGHNRFHVSEVLAYLEAKPCTP